MATIQDYLSRIQNAIYGKDVRQAIHDGIQQCYYDGKAGTIDLEARERISNLAHLEEGSTTGDAELIDARVVGDVTYPSLHDAIDTEFTSVKRKNEYSSTTLDSGGNGILYVNVMGDTPKIIQNVPNESYGYATIDMIGGHSEVVNGSIVDGKPISVVSKDVNNNIIESYVFDQSLLELCDSIGSSAITAYNELNISQKKYIQRVKKVDLSTFEWRMATNVQGLFIATNIPNVKYGIDALCAKYNITLQKLTDTTPDKSMYIFDQYYNGVGVLDRSYNDVASFKASLAGVYLIYELSTENVVDLSSSFNWDGKLKIEDEGVLYFNNSSSLDLPNGTTYQAKAKINAQVDYVSKEVDLVQEAATDKLYNIVLGTTPSYSQDVPAGAIISAKTNSIGGKTVVDGYDLSDSPVTQIVSKNANNDVIDVAVIDDNILKLCEDYGKGLDNYCNELNFKEKKYYRRVKTIDLSNLTWRTTNTTGLYLANTTDREYSAEALCPKYSNVGNRGISDGDDKVIYTASTFYGYNTIAIKDTDYTTLNEFQESLVGVELCYPLKEEIVVSLPSTVLPLIIDIESGGRVIFENNNNEPVPLSVEYYVKKTGSSVENYSIFTLDDFEGETLEDKLYNALDTVDRGYILCGEVNITRPYIAQEKYYGAITIVGATFFFSDLGSEWFDQSNALYNMVIGFSSCYFYGYGNILFSTSADVVRPKFVDCKLYNISVARSNSHYIQSLYLLNCDLDGIDNFATASVYYDLKIIGCRIERSANYSNQNVDDTFLIGSVVEQGTITSSLVEGRRNEVVRIGSAKGFVIENCYFEVLDNGLLVQNNVQGKCGISIRNNSFIGSYRVNYIVNISSNNYVENGGYLSIMDNYIESLHGAFCNVSEYYVTSPDNVKRKIVFNSNGIVTWVAV